MSRHELKRREFLEILMALPLGAAVACSAETGRPLSDVPVSAQEAMKKLVRVLGPWSDAEAAQAEGFAQRFVAASHIVRSYFQESRAGLESLAARFPDGAMAVDELDLEGLPGEEREIAVQLTRDLYSLVEVRFFVSNVPPWGECLGDRTWHTKAPA
jgi:hypothetical protein